MKKLFGTASICSKMSLRILHGLLGRCVKRKDGREILLRARNYISALLLSTLGAELLGDFILQWQLPVANRIDNFSLKSDTSTEWLRKVGLFPPELKLFR